MRTVPDKEARVIAATVVGVFQEIVAIDPPEDSLGGLLDGNVVGAEPALIFGTGSSDILNVIESPGGIRLGRLSGTDKPLLLVGRAVFESSLRGPTVGPGDCEVAGDLDVGNILNICMKTPGGPISIDVNEKI